jgi:hypothetical protein
MAAQPRRPQLVVLMFCSSYYMVPIATYNDSSSRPVLASVSVCMNYLKIILNPNFLAPALKETFSIH